MKRKRFNEQQIIGILKEWEAGGKNQEICRKHGISEQTFYRWRSKYGGLRVSEARRLKQLESENQKLTQLLAEAHLDRAALKELLSKDDYSRECVRQVVDVSITGQRVSRLLDRSAVQRGLPEAITVDNGPEFRGKAMALWSRRTGGEFRYIQPGKPIQNALVESFIGKFRDACLNVDWFVDLADARHSIEAWRIHYNRVRPHSAFGFVSPEQFRLAGDTGCGKAGRCATLEKSPNFPLSHSLDEGDYLKIPHI